MAKIKRINGIEGIITFSIAAIIMGFLFGLGLNAATRVVNKFSNTVPSSGIGLGNYANARIRLAKARAFYN